MNLQKSRGSIEVGKLGDFLVLDHSNWQHLIYQIGDPPIDMVLKKGKTVWQK